jgi:pilus assembly protein Flp/PilA
VNVAKTMTKWLHDEQGATAIEYALVAAAMGLAVVTGLTSLGGGVDTVYGRILEALNDPSVTF